MFFKNQQLIVLPTLPVHLRAKKATNTWSKVNTIFPKNQCARCKKKIRTYCKCNTKVHMCTECYAGHVATPGNTN